MVDDFDIAHDFLWTDSAQQFIQSHIEHFGLDLYRSLTNVDERRELLETIRDKISRMVAIRRETQKALALAKKSKMLTKDRNEEMIDTLRIETIDQTLNVLRSTLQYAETEQKNRKKWKVSRGSKKKRRTKIELESLIPKIIEAYEELYFTGRFSRDEVFRDLEKQSLGRFGERLTAGQLRGLYNRRKTVM